MKATRSSEPWVLLLDLTAGEPEATLLGPGCAVRFEAAKVGCGAGVLWFHCISVKIAFVVTHELQVTPVLHSVQNQL